MKNDNIAYAERKYKMKRNLYRLSLGISQFVIHPALNIIWILFFVGTVFIIKQTDKIISIINVPQSIEPAFKKIMILGIILVLVTFVLGVLYLIAEFMARDIEAAMALALKKNHLKGGSPIITYRRKIKNVYITEIYSMIPLNVWTENKGALVDLMNIQMLTNFEYSDKPNRIIMKYIKIKRHRRNSKIDVYDEDF